MALNSCDDKDITAPYNAVSESIVLRNAADFEALTGAYSYMIKMVELEVTGQNL
jgi:hypothetical protein